MMELFAGGIDLLFHQKLCTTCGMKEAKFMGNAKPIPEGYHTATPYLIIKVLPAPLSFIRKRLARRK